MLLFSGSGAGQPAPFVLTTDTPEYCRHLGDLLSRTLRATPAPPPPDAVDLSSDGRRMCDEGKIRGGILRLRRALVLMQMLPSAP
jgi:hypothetical protein